MVKYWPLAMVLPTLASFNPLNDSVNARMFQRKRLRSRQGHSPAHSHPARKGWSWVWTPFLGSKVKALDGYTSLWFTVVSEIIREQGYMREKETLWITQEHCIINPQHLSATTSGWTIWLLVFWEKNIQILSVLYDSVQWFFCAWIFRSLSWFLSCEGKGKTEGSRQRLGLPLEQFQVSVPNYLKLENSMVNCTQKTLISFTHSLISSGTWTRKILSIWKN